MLLSVIIPIYNAERYLSECVQSVLHEPIKEMELICVNDGSKDKSADILEMIKANDYRVRIINKKNSGYGDSMNIGLDAATGKYIAFLESDDKLVPGTLSKMLELAERKQTEVIKGNYYLWHSETNHAELYDNLRMFSNGELIEKEKFPDLFFLAPSIWSALYNADFLRENKIRFLPTPGASYQDTSFAFKIWARAERVVAVRDPVVYYRQDNADSSSSDTGKVFCICDEFREIERFLKSDELNLMGPIFARVKFISYYWNINRLCPERKIEFLDGIFPELLELRNNNWLKKQFWKDDWLVVNSCIDNLREVENNLREGKSLYEAALNASQGEKKTGC